VEIEELRRDAENVKAWVVVVERRRSCGRRQDKQEVAMENGKGGEEFNREEIDGRK
jgi:hypothetical protein